MPEDIFGWVGRFDKRPKAGSPNSIWKQDGFSHLFIEQIEPVAEEQEEHDERADIEQGLGADLVKIVKELGESDRAAIRSQPVDISQ